MFGLQLLGEVLLHKNRAIERIAQIAGEAHACGGGRRIFQESLLGKIFQALHDQHARVLGDVARRIIERHLATTCCEHDRPGAPNQTGSDHGNTIVHIHNAFLLSARSSRNACDGPVHVTDPRSSTTVRSESASARSRWWSTMIIATS